MFKVRTRFVLARSFELTALRPLCCSRSVSLSVPLSSVSLSLPLSLSLSLSAQWVDESELNNACGRRVGRFDKAVMGATGGLYGSTGRFTTKQECEKADRDDANW